VVTALVLATVLPLGLAAALFQVAGTGEKEKATRSAR
jgi:hypothetical protein